MLYAPFLRNGHPYIQMDLRSAEMTKYAANVMLATRISLMNELSQICEGVGADVMAVRRGVGADSRIGMSFLYPGIGYGGSCFPKDVKALSRLAIETDCAADILDAVDKVNRHQKVTLANRVVSYLGGDRKGRRIGLWGLAFKPHTDDVREAPALVVLRRLTNNPRVSFAPNQYEAIESADALVLATEWPQFRRPDFGHMKGIMKQPLVFDGRNQYEPEEMRKLGFHYICIGRGSL